MVQLYYDTCRRDISWDFGGQDFEHLEFQEPVELAPQIKTKNQDS